VIQEFSPEKNVVPESVQPVIFVELEPEVNDDELMNLQLLSQIALGDSLLEITTETNSLESVTEATTQSIGTETSFTIPNDVHMPPSDAQDPV